MQKLILQPKFDITKSQTQIYNNAFFHFRSQPSHARKNKNLGHFSNSLECPCADVQLYVIHCNESLLFRKLKAVFSIIYLKISCKPRSVNCILNFRC